MNIANQLPDPLNGFVIDVPANQYYDFELPPGSSYPLPGVTYPVDYGNVPGYFSEDGHELDLYVGQDVDGEKGYIVVYRGEDRPDEHKFYVGLSGAEVAKVLDALKPVLRKHTSVGSMDELLAEVEKFKQNSD